MIKKQQQRWKETEEEEFERYLAFQLLISFFRLSGPFFCAEANNRSQPLLSGPNEISHFFCVPVNLLNPGHCLIVNYLSAPITQLCGSGKDKETLKFYSLAEMKRFQEKLGEKGLLWGVCRCSREDASNFLRSFS